MWRLAKDVSPLSRVSALSLFYLLLPLTATNEATYTLSTHFNCSAGNNTEEFVLSNSRLWSITMYSPCHPALENDSCSYSRDCYQRLYLPAYSHLEVLASDLDVSKAGSNEVYFKYGSEANQTLLKELRPGLVFEKFTMKEDKFLVGLFMLELPKGQTRTSAPAFTFTLEVKVSPMPCPSTIPHSKWTPMKDSLAMYSLQCEGEYRTSQGSRQQMVNCSQPDWRLTVLPCSKSYSQTVNNSKTVAAAAFGVVVLLGLMVWVYLLVKVNKDCRKTSGRFRRTERMEPTGSREDEQDPQRPDVHYYAELEDRDSWFGADVEKRAIFGENAQMLPNTIDGYEIPISSKRKSGTGTPLATERPPLGEYHYATGQSFGSALNMLSEVHNSRESCTPYVNNLQTTSHSMNSSNTGDDNSRIRENSELYNEELRPLFTDTHDYEEPVETCEHDYYNLNEGIQYSMAAHNRHQDVDCTELYEKPISSICHRKYDSVDNVYKYENTPLAGQKSRSTPNMLGEGCSASSKSIHGNLGACKPQAINSIESRDAGEDDSTTNRQVTGSYVEVIP